MQLFDQKCIASALQISEDILIGIGYSFKLSDTDYFALFKSFHYLIFEAPIELPVLILPYIKEHFGEKADESWCRMISFELVAVLQIVLYRKNDFSLFTGVPFKTSEDFRAFINRQVNLLFCNCFAIDCLMMKAAEKLAYRGRNVPVWMSANMPDGNEKIKLSRTNILEE